ncbi:MAG: hypothetical protein P1V20_01865 [Verrucomicrobiales bacterium]|nr:hypothetical protein [Verrucomicrobiales bacterium]
MTSSSSGNSLLIYLIIALFPAFIGLAGFSIFRNVEVAVPTGTTFLTHLADDSTGSAFRLTSDRFQADHTRLQFETKTRALGIDSIQKIDWSKASIERDKLGNDSSCLLAKVQTEAGKVIKVSLRLDHENGNWKVASFRKACTSAS